MENGSPPRVLIVAGTDPLCGAGCVADALVLSRLGVAPLVVESAIVEQDSNGAYGAHPVALDLFERQLRRVITDARPHVVKVGLLASPAQVEVLARVLFAGAVPSFRVVIDPVLLASGGQPLVRELAEMPRAILSFLRAGVLITPNASELALLTQSMAPRTVADAAALASGLAAATGADVLAKGGHLEPRGTDLLVKDGQLRSFSPIKWAHGDIHGTGCHLASAIAAGLALGLELSDAVAAARRLLARLSRDAVAIGRGRMQFVHLRRGL